MPSLRIIPLTGAALEKYYAQKAEDADQDVLRRACSDTMHNECGFFQHPQHDEHKECDGRNDIDICSYKDKDRHENEDIKERYLSDAGLDKEIDKCVSDLESHDHLASYSMESWERKKLRLYEEHHSIVSSKGNITSISNTLRNSKRLKLNHESHEKEEQKNEGRYPTILEPKSLKELELEKMLLIETDNQLAQLDQATELKKCKMEAKNKEEQLRLEVELEKMKVVDERRARLVDQATELKKCDMEAKKKREAESRRVDARVQSLLSIKKRREKAEENDLKNIMRLRKKLEALLANNADLNDRNDDLYSRTITLKNEVRGI